MTLILPGGAVELIHLMDVYQGENQSGRWFAAQYIGDRHWRQADEGLDED